MDFSKNTKTLLRADYQAWLNSFTKDGQVWRKNVFKGIGYLVFIVALSFLGYSLFKHLRSNNAPEPLLLSVINGFMVFGIIVIVKELMESSLDILYEAKETHLLHAAPIKPITIFSNKFIHITISRVMSILCFLGPPWVVFGVISEFPWHYYVVLIPAALCILIIIASYVTISMMVMVRFFSSTRLFTTLKVFGKAIGVIVGFLLSFTLISGTDELPFKNFFLKWASTNSTGTNAAWSPLNWMGNFLLSWGTESTVWVRSQLILVGICIMVVSVVLALLTAQWIYQRGWENIRLLKSKRRSVRVEVNTTVSQLSQFSINFLRGKLHAMIMKDFFVFIRRTGRLIAIIMLTLFLVVHIGIIYVEGNYALSNNTTILTVQIILYSLLITFGISCNGLRDEAKTWWMMKSAPITPTLVYTSKYLTSLFCAFIYAEFWSFISILVLRFPVENWMIFLVTPMLALPTACALNTTIGTLPWMAELANKPKPFLRVVTFTTTLFINVAFIIIPIIFWNMSNMGLFLISLSVLWGILAISYKVGVEYLRKLLVVN